MMLTAIQLLKSGMGKAGAADLLQALARAVQDGEVVSLSIGEVVLNVKDDAMPRQ